MNVSQIVNGPMNLNNDPFPQTFAVANSKQALFVAGSVWWDIPEPTSGMHESPPEHVGVEVLIDATRVMGKLEGGTSIGFIRLGKCENGFHAAVVPAVFPLALPKGNHTVAFRNENNAGKTTVQSGLCYFSAALFDFD
jgi:hypothetical protein